MAASQLGVFNKALRWLEERKALNTSESREALRYLNDEWTDAVLFCLYAGYWNFAIRSIQITADANQAPAFGKQFCFTKPPDWTKTYQFADNPDYMPLLRDFEDLNNVWYANINPIYIKYLSNDPNFGLNMALWTPGFIEYLAAYLAFVCAPRLKMQGDITDRLEKLQLKKKLEGLSQDAMDQAVGKPPYGSWVMSRAPRGSMGPGWGSGGWG